MAKFTGNVSSDGLGNPGMATEQGKLRFGKTLKQKRKEKEKKKETAGREKGSKEYFENLEKLETHKSELRHTEQKGKANNDAFLMREKASIGDQEISNFTGAHVPNLMEAMGADKLQTVNMATTAGNRLSVAAAKAEKTPKSETETSSPETPASPETETSAAPESRVEAMKTGRNEPKERTPTYREVRAGVAEWRKTKGESGVSPEEGVNLGNETYNRKAAAKAGYAEEKASSIGRSPQFGDTNSVGSADAQKKA